VATPTWAVCDGQATFGCLHVRPPTQQVAGVADRQGGDQRTDVRLSLNEKRVERTGTLAGQDGQTVVGALFGRDQARDRSLGGVEAGLSGRDVDRAAGPGVEPHLGQAHGLALGREVAVGDLQASLGAAQFEVISSHFRRDRDLGVAQLGLGRAGVSARRLDAPTHAAEQVDLPAGVEAGLVGRAFDALAVRAGLLLVALHIRAVGGDVRQQVELLFGEQGPGLGHARDGDLQVEIGREGLADQLIQHRVAERLPPFRLRIGGGEDGRVGVLEGRRRGRRRLVVRPHRAGGGRQGDASDQRGAQAVSKDRHQ
jgi:hypothetical protein